MQILSQACCLHLAFHVPNAPRGGAIWKRHSHTACISSCQQLPASSRRNPSQRLGSDLKAASYASESSTTVQDAGDPAEQMKLSQVAKRLEQTGRYFKRLGSWGFWSQLGCILVSAGITAFSSAITGRATSPVTFYLNVAGIAAGFISVFWSFGYIRLGSRLQNSDPKKAPPRFDVVQNIKNGVKINLLGMCSTLLGMLATVGVLVAKSLTSSGTPFFQNSSPSYSPVLALDVFLVQASANAMLSHFLGLLFSLELLRSVTLSQQNSPEKVVPKPA